MCLWIDEVYDEKMIAPLKAANITVSSTNMNTDFRSVWGLNYLLFGTDKSPHGSWHLDVFCLNDAYFADGGNIVVTDFYKPSSCDTYISIIVWRVLLWFLIVLTLLSCVSCFYCLRKRTKKVKYAKVWRM